MEKAVHQAIQFDRKFLIKLVMPLIIEQVLAVSVGMADMIMVSGAGETAVSGGIAGKYNFQSFDLCVYGFSNRRGCCGISGNRSKTEGYSKYCF